MQLWAVIDKVGGLIDQTTILLLATAYFCWDYLLQTVIEGHHCLLFCKLHAMLYLYHR
jgi:hypothetical protein